MSTSLSEQSSDEVSSREMPTSDSEDEGEEEEEEYEDFDEDFTVTVARPPEGLSQGPSMAAADILEYLDQLIDSNKISSERGSRLKHIYSALLESIEKSRAAENTWMMKVKELQQKFTADQQTLEKADGFPESYSSEMSHLRQLLLQHQNELMESEEKGSKLDHEIELLEEELKQTQFEYDHLPKKEEIEAKIEGLKKEVQSVQDEISDRNLDIGKVKLEKEKKDEAVETIKKETAQLLTAESSLEDELAALTLAPVGIPREMDKLRKAIKECNVNMSESNEMMEELEKEIQRQEEQTDALRKDLTALKENLDEEKRSIDAKQVSDDSLAKNIATGKEHESTHIEEEVSLDLQKKLKQQEHKVLYESLASKGKEKDKELKLLKKADLQLRSAQSGLEQQERLLEPLVTRSQDTAELNQRRNEALDGVRSDVEALRKVVAQQVGHEEVEGKALSLHISKERHFRELSKKHRHLVADIGKEVIAMTRQRDIRSKDFYNAQQELLQAEYDQKTRHSQIDDQQKKLRDLDTSLRDFAQAYEVVKTERNKTYSHIQTCQQLSAEMKEKIKVLQNESEILQNAVDSKTKVLTRGQLALISKSQDRDTQHQELTKVRLHQEETRNDLEQQREILHKLTQQINSMELSLKRLKSYYEHSVRDRNAMGLQLIERNEEVCVFHEKLNVQDSICREGNMQLMEKEEEIRVLKMEVAKLNRELNTAKQVVPEKDVLERDLTRCHNQLLSVKETVKYLEQRVTDANNPERLRLLPGDDPSCSELREKLEKLQAQLTDYEQRVLEKDLLLEQVSRLSERLKKKESSRRQTTLQIGNKVNSYQSKLRDGTRKMMALVSELSLQRALTIRLQQEVNEKETKLEQAYSRLDSGEAPDEESAKEWIRILHNETMSNREQEIIPDEGRELSNGVYTMAEPRPNAYIPESEIELPLPKPYGAHAPFKPSHPGANMRHIRKPQPPPIDI